MFKIGQKVVCINDKGTTYLKENEIYTVIGFHENYPDAILLAEGRNDIGYKGFWQLRFRDIDNKWAEEYLCKLTDMITEQDIKQTVKNIDNRKVEQLNKPVMRSSFCIGYKCFCRVTNFIKLMPYPIRQTYWIALYYYNKYRFPSGDFTLELYRSYAK